MASASHTDNSLPSRPINGLMAWQATLGYISTRLSPDAVLRIQAYSREARMQWDASLTWAQKEEKIEREPSLAYALRNLWKEVNRNHHIFDTPEDIIKAPAHYSDTDWLDLTTQESLQRLLWVTQSAFPGNWHLVIVYQPVEEADRRFHGRLLLNKNKIVVGGQGHSLLEACRTLFRNATPHYATSGGR